MEDRSNHEEDDTWRGLQRWWKLINQLSPDFLVEVLSLVATP